MPFKANADRRRHIPKQKRKVTNWAAYDASLRQRGGSVSARASKYSWLDEGRDFSGGFQHTQNRCGAAKEEDRASVVS
jgi:hypothetical protein